MKVNTPSKPSHRQDAKPSPNSAASLARSIHDDEQTMKYCTPVKKTNQQLSSSLDQDNEATITFQRITKKFEVSQPSISSPSKANCVSGLMNSFSASQLNPSNLSSSLPKSQRFLIDIMVKIDGYLQFISRHRGKQHDNFKNIKKNLSDNFNITIDFFKIRSILYLLPNAYICTKVFGDSSDVRMRLPQGKISIELRKNELCDAIYKYIEEKHNEFMKKAMLSKNDIQIGQRWVSGFDLDIQIPCLELTFEKVTDIDPKKRQPVVPTILLGKMQQVTKPKIETIQPLSILDRSKLASFKQKLYRIIKQKQLRLNEEKKIKQKAGEECNLKLICYANLCESLSLYFTQCMVSNIFMVTVIEQLAKRISYNEKEIRLMIQRITKKCKGFLSIIALPKGNILHINKHMAKDATEIIYSEGFLD